MKSLGYLLLIAGVLVVAWFLFFGGFKNEPFGPEENNSSITQPAGTERYQNQDYRVSFFYPSNWEPDQPEGVSGGGNPIRYSGADGFFSIDATGTQEESLGSVVQSIASHRLEPYGSSPKILKTNIFGQEGTFIFPSEDQRPEAKKEAVLIVDYQDPVVVEFLPGLPQTYSFFILYADKDNIESIAETISFSGP